MVSARTIWRPAVLAIAMLPSLGCDRSDVRGPAGDLAAPSGTAAQSGEQAGERDVARGDGEHTDAKTAVAPEPARPPTPADAGSCPERDADDVGILFSPARPVVGAPLVVLAATLDDERMLALRIEQGGAAIEATVVHERGIPAASVARIAAAPKGKLEVIVGRDGHGLRCATVKIEATARGRMRTPAADAVWPIDRAWNGAEEALYSAWVRGLFHAPRGEELARKALHELTSDSAHNLLHDHFGWGEDRSDTKLGLHLRPDCADTPYFLRAYYAWKRGLPFGFRGCSRGGPGKAPRCGKLRTVASAPDGVDASKPGELGVVQKYFRRTLAWGVHTGNGRTAFGDDATDFYPVALTRRGLRPGTIYADPYGHVFVLVELMDAVGAEPGVLYAIDGQPDGSITRKRFWEGNFLWNPDPGLGGSGFKAARPIDVVREGGEAVLRAASDDEIRARPGYGDASDEQRSLEPAQFYDRMDGLITPGKRDALRAQAEAVQALLEAAVVRVTSVDNGETHFAGGGGTIAMPSGHAIFETTGAWENFATPARDLRLLIAIDLVNGFEHKVERNPAAFLVEGTAMDALVESLRKDRARMLADPALSFEYRRSDGSMHEVTLGELVGRAAAFEHAYNPNECPELRWGAAAGSEEARTCKRHAPAEQVRKMKAYRVWFHERRRPARGDPGPAVQ
jgi:hypothetical protein